MYMTSTADFYTRGDDDDGSTLSKQNVIIIAFCSSFGGVLLAYFLYRNIRNCLLRSESTPHPLPQPLSHHRQQEVAQVEQRATTWYEPRFAAGHHLSPSSARGSKASLLGSDGPGFVSSIPPSIDSAREPSDFSHQHLPPPSASYLHDRPSTSTSLASSEGSCAPAVPSPQDLAVVNPIRPSSTVSGYSPASTPARRPRPLSMLSSHTHGSVASRSTRISGVPHAPHNQIQIILPTPLASANNSRESLTMTRGRYGSSAGDRRSIADAWISMPGHTLAHRSSESLTLPERPPSLSQPPPRRRHVSVGVPTSRMQYDPGNAPPIPTLRSVSESDHPPPVGKTRSQRLEKRRTLQTEEMY